MDTRIRSLLVPLALLSGACQASDDAASDAGDATADATPTADIDALRASYVEHYNMGHPDMVADMYAEDAIALMADGGVLLGREAIAAGLAEQMAEGSPELALEQIDQMAFGDTAVTIGAWSVTVTPEGADPVTRGGHYMVGHVRGDEGWQISGVITNHDAQQSAEVLQGTVPPEPPEEESILGSFLEAYEAAWNAGDAEAVAGLYAEDAWYAGADLPAVEGREAIRQIMEQRLRGEIDIHGVGSWELGDGWVLDGGWFEISGAEEGDYVGNYWILTHAAEGGERQVQWIVTNGRPESVIPAAESGS
ncbi:MAG: YybH family protein [Gemmatimonadota bacterium]